MTWTVRTTLSILVLALSIPGMAVAQQTGDPNHEWCDQDSWGDRRTNRYCEVRKFTVDAVAGALRVDGGPNGGIMVDGWNQNSVRVLAKVEAWSGDDDAETIVRQISVDTGRTISAGRAISAGQGFVRLTPVWLKM